MLSTLEQTIEHEIARLSGTRCRCGTCETRAVDRAEHSIARATGCGCGCARCQSRGLAQARADAADEAARPARRQTRGGRLTLDHFQGWTAPVSLAALRQARGGPIPPALRPFFATGRPNLYRLSRAGIDRARPLSIGMTRTQKPIFERIHEHKHTAQGDPRVQAALAHIPEGSILVQAGILRGPGLSVSLAHVYEGLLQARERPQLKDPSTTTFED